jgi:putative DNA methylase
MTTPAEPVIKRKLIEVSLPIEAINAGSVHEKSVPRRGHPATMHLWWARRPLATARAVIFAQLVDDPSSHPEQFPTLEAQGTERERLHDIIRKLVVWENLNDEGLLKDAHAEILRSTGGNPPPILDPFAGGGTIPLEAQRLGLTAQASDLNPVAVLINKALIEIPPKFTGRPPVFPGAAESKLGSWTRATGLAEDVRRYGAGIREEAVERIGSLYPKATLADGSKATVIAWIWTHTVACPNPACGIEMPLVRSRWLGKKKGKEAYVVPTIVDDKQARSGRKVVFSIGHDLKQAPTADNDGTVRRTGAICIACGSAADLAYVRAEGRAGRLGQQMMAIVAEGNRRRIYLDPTHEHESAAAIGCPEDVPEGELGNDPRAITAPNYGMTRFADLFTHRQLTALITFSDLVTEVRKQVLADAMEAGLPEGDRLEAGGTEAAAYADAVATYCAFAVSKLADWSSSLCSWIPQIQGVTHTFARQALPMVWDFTEVNPLSNSVGNFLTHTQWVADGVAAVPSDRLLGQAIQADAASVTTGGALVSTDPPYYDNIGYSDLSDFFYVWLRRSLRDVHPALLSTLLVPKAEELVANPFRHGGKEGASEFFERGFEHVFARVRESALEDYPIAVYYAFKQAELASEGVASTGWATLLEGMIRSGWTITGTWPVRSERSGRLRNLDSNALASSVVLALRPRHITAEATSRRGFLVALKAELPNALRELQQGAIAPVDLAQATIGPGMAVFSRYNKVVEADGSSMTVKTALALINHALDEVLAAQDGDLDSDTRFCITWFTQYGWSEQAFGEADVLARAMDISVEGLARGGVLTSKAGKVTLLSPADLDPSWDPLADDRISLWEATMHLARSLDVEGGETTARLMSAVGQRVELEAVQLLAYRLYELTQATRPQDALLFNGLGTSWSDLTASARRADVTPRSAQSTFDFDAIEGE